VPALFLNHLANGVADLDAALLSSPEDVHLRQTAASCHIAYRSEGKSLG
jgi:hypothetical protein